MHRVIYASTSIKPLTPPELDDLASVSEKNNINENITGLLLYGDQSFFQVFEGPDDNVVSMKERIWNDSRHRGISEFMSRVVDDRIFSEWTMGCYLIDFEPTTATRWTIVDLDSILDRLPPAASPEISVLARTFFNGIAPRK